jgi:hypothetical protein
MIDRVHGFTESPARWARLSMVLNGYISGRWSAVHPAAAVVILTNTCCAAVTGTGQEAFPPKLPLAKEMVHEDATLAT